MAVSTVTLGCHLLWVESKYLARVAWPLCIELKTSITGTIIICDDGGTTATLSCSLSGIVEEDGPL